MTRARAAAEFREHWLHMIAKAPLERLFCSGDDHFGLRGISTRFGANCRLAISHRNRDAIFDAHDIGITRSELKRVRDLPDELFAIDSLKHELLPRGRAAQCDRLRNHDERITATGAKRCRNKKRREEGTRECKVDS